jgi:sugar/nucleoside kinase (ribokinase family)
LGKYGHGSKIKISQSDVDLIKRSGGIYCAGYTLRESHLVDLALEAMRLAHQFNIPVFFDPGPQMAAVPVNVRNKTLPLVSTILTTEEELPFLVESGLVADLMKLGPQMVVVKKGPGGCAIYTAGRVSPEIEAPGYPVSVVDTSAAGDSFNAAFMAATLWGWSLPDCAKLANAVGAAKVQKLGGGRNVPTLAEVNEINQQFKVGLKL